MVLNDKDIDKKIGIFKFKIVGCKKLNEIINYKTSDVYIMCKT